MGSKVNSKSEDERGGVRCVRIEKKVWYGPLETWEGDWTEDMHMVPGQHWGPIQQWGTYGQICVLL
jgi:hypothetical protein